MSNYRETVYRGRDNKITLALDDGGRILDAGGVTRCQLVFKQEGVSDFLVDSEDNGEMFDFDQQDVVRGVRLGVLVLKLGTLDAEDVPDGLYKVDVYLFDSVNTNAAYWDSIEVLVRDGDVPAP